MPHLSESQKRYLPLFTQYVDIDTGNTLNSDFAHDVEVLRGMGESMTRLDEVMQGNTDSTPFSDFIVKYGFNTAMVDFLYTYLIHGKVDPLLINSGMFIVSEADDTAIGRQGDEKLDHFIYERTMTRNDVDELKLVIPAGVTLNEVKDFLDRNWVSFIHIKQELYRTQIDAPAGRIRSADTVFNKRVLGLVMAKVPYAEIATKVNEEFGSTVTYKNIADLVYREKRKS